MPRIYFKRRPDGSPRTDGPVATLPDDALMLHEHARAWVLRHHPDLPMPSVNVLVYVEALEDPALKGSWGDLLATFKGASTDRHKILDTRLDWLSRQTVQSASLIANAVDELLMAARLTSDERGN